MSNIENSSKSKNDSEVKIKVQTSKPAFVPVKDKIHLMEKDQAKSTSETEEFMQKHKSIMAQKFIENCDDEPKLSDGIERNGNDQTDKNGHDLKNGQVHNETSPPKPLPRKSISDQGSFDEVTGVVIPKPRPRTACPNITYKVSLSLNLLIVLRFLDLS